QDASVRVVVGLLDPVLLLPVGVVHRQLAIVVLGLGRLGLIMDLLQDTFDRVVIGFADLLLFEVVGRRDCCGAGTVALLGGVQRPSDGRDAAGVLGVIGVVDLALLVGVLVVDHAAARHVRLVFMPPAEVDLIFRLLGGIVVEVDDAIVRILLGAFACVDPVEL